MSATLLATAVSSYGWCCALRGGVFGEDFVQRLDGGVHVSALQDKWRQKTQHGIAGAIDQDVALQHLGDGEFGHFSRIKLGSNHESLAAHIYDGFVTRGERAELGLE